MANAMAGSITVDEQTAVSADKPDYPSANIERKLDQLAENMQFLSEQVALLTAKAQTDSRRQEEWDDLRADLTPVINDLYGVTVEQLNEIQSEVHLEDLLALLKRFLRSTRSLTALLDQLESANDLLQDISPLTKDMFSEVVTLFSELENRGYFGFVRQGQYVIDQIVTSFSEEDVRLLGDNIVLILNTMKTLTQPEMMTMVNNLTQGFREAEAEVEQLPTSMLGIMGQMRDPDVRRGLALTMNMLKRVSQQSKM